MNETVALVAAWDWVLFNFRMPIARALRAAGFDVIFVCPRGKYVDRLEAEGFHVVSWGVARRGLNPVGGARSVVALARIYRAHNVACVLHFTIKPIVLGTVAARLSRVPRIVNTYTGLGYLFGATRQASALRAVLRPWVALLNRSPSVQTVVQNEDDHAALVRSGWLGNAAPLTVIRGSGVDLASFTPRTDHEEGDLVVLFAGRLLATKGVRELVAAAHLLAAREAPVRVRIAGEPDPGNPESIDEDSVTKWRNEAVVEMPGHVDDIVAELMNAQIAVLPSEREGVPRFLLEAAAAGIPSVATDVPGNRDVIDHEETGLLIESADPIAIADAIERLVRSPTLRSEMGARARSKAEENFSIERVATAYVDLVVQSVGGSPSSLRFEP